jgi:hypothetical protein
MPNQRLTPIYGFLNPDASLSLLSDQFSSMNFDGALRRIYTQKAVSELKAGDAIHFSASENDEIIPVLVSAVELDDSEDPLYQTNPVYFIYYIDQNGEDKNYTLGAVTTDGGYVGTELVYTSYEDPTTIDVGTSGWTITKYGNAVFSNVFTRGTVEATSGKIDGILTIGSDENTAIQLGKGISIPGDTNIYNGLVINDTNYFVTKELASPTFTISSATTATESVSSGLSLVTFTINAHGLFANTTGSKIVNLFGFTGGLISLNDSWSLNTSATNTITVIVPRITAGTYTGLSAQLEQDGITIRKAVTSVVISDVANVTNTNITFTAFRTNAVTAVAASSPVTGSATYTATGHTFSVGDIVIISGASVAGYNGTFTITAAATNAFTVINATTSAATFTSGLATQNHNYAVGSYVNIAGLPTTLDGVNGNFTVFSVASNTFTVKNVTVTGTTPYTGLSASTYRLYNSLSSVFNVGSSTNFMKYDSATDVLQVSGKIIASTIDIGGGTGISYNGTTVNIGSSVIVGGNISTATGIITGQTFRTSATATTNGVIFDSAGVRGYNTQVEKFNLSSSGLLTVTDANVTGTLTATSGSFTGTVNILNSGKLVAGNTTDGVTIDSTGLYGYEQGIPIFTVPTSSAIPPSIANFKVVETTIYSDGLDANLVVGTRGFAGLISATGTVGTVTLANGTYSANITVPSSTTNVVIGQTLTATNGTGSLGSFGVLVRSKTVNSVFVASAYVFTAGTVTNITGTGGNNITVRGQDSGGLTPTTPAAIFTTINGTTTSYAANTGFYIDRMGYFKVGSSTANAKFNPSTNTFSVTGYIEATSGIFKGNITMGNGTRKVDIGPSVSPRNLSGIYYDNFNYWYTDGEGNVEFHLGDNTNSLEYSGASLQVTGTVVANSAFFGGSNGWEITSDGKMTSGIGGSYIALASADAEISDSKNQIFTMSEIIIDDEAYDYYDPDFPTDFISYSTIYVKVPVNQIAFYRYATCASMIFGSSTITVDSGVGLVPGMIVTGAGIQTATVITSINPDNNKIITLSKTIATAGTNVAITFNSTVDSVIDSLQDRYVYFPSGFTGNLSVLNGKKFLVQLADNDTYFLEDGDPLDPNTMYDFVNSSGVLSTTYVTLLIYGEEAINISTNTSSPITVNSGITTDAFNDILTVVNSLQGTYTTGISTTSYFPKVTQGTRTYMLWGGDENPTFSNLSVSLNKATDKITILADAGTTPVGSIVMWSAATLPPGWLICNGDPVSSTLNPELYAIVGANVPDLRNRFIVGAGSSYGVNASGGGANHNHGDNFTFTTPSHDHNITGGSHAHSDNISASTNSNALGTGNAISSTRFTAASTTHNHTVTIAGSVSTDSSHAHNVVSASAVDTTKAGSVSAGSTIPPYYALYFIIYSGRA